MKKSLTNHPEQPLADEQTLLEHYRQHSLAQPSAAVDKLILAAATAELSRAKPSILSWSQRWQHWLFGSGQRVGWSVAFASLASIGLGLGLSLHSVDDLPPAYDLGEPLPSISAAPAPAPAPAPAAMAQPMAEAKELKKSVAPAKPTALAAPSSPVLAEDKTSRYSKAESAADTAQVRGELKANSNAVAKQQAADAPSAELADSAVKTEPRVEQAKSKTTLSLEQQLQALLQLQRSGDAVAATAELERLQRLYPQHDLAAELSKLRDSQP